MTQDEIIRMAREAGYQSVYLSDAPIGRSYQFLERFAALVAAHAKSEQINLAYQQGYEEGSAHEREKQAEQEPMYISKDCVKRGCACHYSVEVDGEPVAVYFAPVRTKDPCNPLQDLTDDEIDEIESKILIGGGEYIDVIRAVIAADREKNK